MSKVMRRVERRQLKKKVATAPVQVLQGMEQLQDLNQTLHQFNKVLLEVLFAADKYIEGNLGDLTRRMRLSQAISNAKRTYKQLMREAIEEEKEAKRDAVSDT